MDDNTWFSASHTGLRPTHRVVDARRTATAPNKQAPQPTTHHNAWSDSSRSSSGPTTKATHSQPTATAAQRVFGIGELVELILLSACPITWKQVYHEDQIETMRLILIFQQVNTTMRDAVQHSTKIKRMMHMRYSLQGEPRIFRIHPLLWCRDGNFTRKIDKWPLGHGIAFYKEALLLTIDDQAAAGLSQDRGSWRHLLLAWNRGDYSKCGVRWLDDGVKKHGDMELNLEGIESAGELADAIVSEMKTKHLDELQQILGCSTSTAQGRDFETAL